jgi:hypothetical protein
MPKASGRIPRPGKQSALRPFEAPQTSSSAIDLEPTSGDPADWPAKALLLFERLHLHYRALESRLPAAQDLHTPDLRRHHGAPRRARRAACTGRQGDPTPEPPGGRAIAVVFAVLAATDDVLERPLHASLFAGVIGAVVSMMTRMTTVSLVLRPKSRKWMIRFLGAFRPAIGAVFGAASDVLITVLVAGGLLSFAEPTDVDPARYYAGIAFVAGFTERPAQDVIAGESSSLAIPSAGTVGAEPVR